MASPWQFLPFSQLQAGAKTTIDSQNKLSAAGRVAVVGEDLTRAVFILTPSFLWKSRRDAEDEIGLSFRSRGRICL